MKKSIIILFTIIISLNSYSGVNLKNGNFYISYTDIILQDTLWQDLEITRTYNSKSTYNGSFGYGWGFLFETHLIVTPEHTIALKKYGSGGTYFFESEQTSEESIQKNISLIIAAAYKANDISTPEQEVELIDKLTSSMSIRFTYLTRYTKLGYISAISHNSDITYYSQGCGCIGENKPGYNYITSTDNGFKYFDFQENNIFIFNKIGKMIGLESMKNSKWNLTITYNEKNQLDSIKSYNGNWIAFESDSLNRIVEINNSISTKYVGYKYNNITLVHSENVAGYQFDYIYDRKYNLSKIVYNPIRFKGEKEDAMQMTYENKTSFISQVISRDSSYVTYTYLGDSDYEYGTRVINYSKDSIVLKDLTEWWYIKTNDHGKQWTYKKMNILNTDTTTTFFHEISLKPLKVITSDNIYIYTFSPKGLLLTAQSLSLNILYVNYDNNQNMSSLKYKDEKFTLVMGEKTYSELILPNKNRIDLPIKDFNLSEIGDYKSKISEIKKLLEYSYYKIF